MRSLTPRPVHLVIFALMSACVGPVPAQPSSPPEPSPQSRDAADNTSVHDKHWYCFINNRTKGDSGCGADQNHCEEIRRARALAYARNEFPFTPTACEPHETPACFQFRDMREARNSPKYFRCFQSEKRCELAQALLTLPYYVTDVCMEMHSLEDLLQSQQ